MDWKAITKLVSTLAWSVVVAAGLFTFRKPLDAFLSGPSGRMTKLSVFNISMPSAK